MMIGWSPTKAQQKLGWRPKYNLEQLIEEMVMVDIRLITKKKTAFID
jgi:GDPmannose 4,6-dehydratase